VEDTHCLFLHPCHARLSTLVSRAWTIRVPQELRALFDGCNVLTPSVVKVSGKCVHWRTLVQLAPLCIHSLDLQESNQCMWVPEFLQLISDQSRNTHLRRLRCLRFSALGKVSQEDVNYAAVLLQFLAQGPHFAILWIDSAPMHCRDWVDLLCKFVGARKDLILVLNCPWGLTVTAGAALQPKFRSFIVRYALTEDGTTLATGESRWRNQLYVSPMDRLQRYRPPFLLHNSSTPVPLSADEWDAKIDALAVSDDDSN
jgi:hypothetical protein